jgi:hypothetical protein
MGCHRSPGAGAFSVFTHASCGRTVGCVATSAAGTRLAGHVVAGATGQNGAPRRRTFRSARDALGSSRLPGRTTLAATSLSLGSFVLELENNSMLRLFSAQASTNDGLAGRGMAACLNVLMEFRTRDPGSRDRTHRARSEPTSWTFRCSNCRSACLLPRRDLGRHRSPSRACNPKRCGRLELVPL